MNARSLLFSLPDISNRVFGRIRGVFFFFHYPVRRALEQPLHSLKIAESAYALTPFVRVIAPHAKKIILFGSRGRGTNRPNSDYDIFIITNAVKETKILAKKASINLLHPIDMVVYTPNQAAAIDSIEPALAEKLRNGVLLWQSPDQDIHVKTTHSGK